MKKLICIILTAAILLISASAAVINSVDTSYDYSNAENWKTRVAVKGKLVSGKMNERVSAALVYDNKIVSISEAVSERGGEYTVALNLSQNAESGEYIVRVGSYSMDNYVEYELTIITARAKVSLIENINSAASAAQIKEKLKSAIMIPEYNLQFPEIMSLIADDADNEVYSLIYQLKSANQFSANDDEAFLIALKNATTIVALNLKKTVDLGQMLPAFLGLDSRTLIDYSDLNETAKSRVLQMLQGKNFGINAVFLSEVRDSVILAGISYPKTLGYGPVQNVLDRYSDVLSQKGFDMEKYSSNKVKIATDLIGIYNSMGDFKTAFDNAIKKLSTSGTGGGSLTGGGGSYSGAVSIAVPDIGNQKPKALPFGDLQDVPWAVESITQLFSKGVINGIGEGVFLPNESIKREEFAKILCIAFEIKGSNGSNGYFDDVSSGAWYYEYTSALKSAGISNGTGGGKFGVGLNITRADAATMIVKAISADKLPSKVNISFTDIDEIPSYAFEAVDKLAKSGIVSGKGEGAFYPLDSITRAEASKIIYSVLTAMEGGYN